MLMVRSCMVRSCMVRSFASCMAPGGHVQLRAHGVLMHGALLHGAFLCIMHLEDRCNNMLMVCPCMVRSCMVRSCMVQQRMQERTMQQRTMQQRTMHISCCNSPQSAWDSCPLNGHLPGH